MEMSKIEKLVSLKLKRSLSSYGNELIDRKYFED
jgi:hypothetical protein